MGSCFIRIAPYLSEYMRSGFIRIAPHLPEYMGSCFIRIAPHLSAHGKLFHKDSLHENEFLCSLRQHKETFMFFYGTP